MEKDDALKGLLIMEYVANSPNGSMGHMELKKAIDTNSDAYAHLITDGKFENMNAVLCGLQKMGYVSEKRGTFIYNVTSENMQMFFYDLPEGIVSQGELSEIENTVLAYLEKEKKQSS